MAKLYTNTLKVKSASKLTIQLSTGARYVFVNHYDTIIAKGFIENGELQGIEVYSSVPSTSDLRAINEVLVCMERLRKLRGFLSLKETGKTSGVIYP